MSSSAAKARSTPKPAPVSDTRGRSIREPEATRSHVLQAITNLDQGTEHPFGAPTRYQLVHKGKSYPPKAVLALAAKHATGAPFKPEDFSGGEDTGQANSVLRDLGFEIESIAGAPGEDGSESAVDLIVADYFSMLETELPGQVFSKTEHRNRNLRARFWDRTR